VTDDALAESLAVYFAAPSKPTSAAVVEQLEGWPVGARIVLLLRIIHSALTQKEAAITRALARPSTSLGELRRMRQDRLEWLSEWYAMGRDARRAVRQMGAGWARP
jgi:hypothetical protein